MVPPELLAFLRTPGRTLAVKGRAGTGKTLLALELARRYQTDVGDVLWANSRDTDPASAAELEKVVPPGRQRSYADAASPLDDALAASGEDLASAYAALEDIAEGARDARRPLVVIDSLDGLTEGFSRHDRARFVSAAVRLARRLRASLLVVIESADPDPADYLVDGVFGLADRVVDGMRVRELRLEKLRGTALARTAYAFTLAEGRFAAYVPTEAEPPLPPVRPPPRPDSGDFVSTGTHDWDLLVGGGLARGSVHLLELGPHVGPARDVLLVPLAINTLNMGRGFAYLSPLDELGERLSLAVAPHVSPPRRAPAALDVLAGGALVAPLPFGDGEASPDERVAPLELARESRRPLGPVVSVLSVDALVGAFGTERAGAWLARWTSDTRRHGDVDVLLGREGLAGPAALADSRWRLDIVLGAPAFRGLVPSSEHHLVIHDAARGFPESRFLPVH